MCLKGRSYEFKRVEKSVIIYGQGPLVSVATTTAAIQTLEESKGEFVSSFFVQAAVCFWYFHSVAGTMLMDLH